MRSTANIASHPIHPMLVSLPIGLWIGAFVFSAISLSTGFPLLAAAGFYTAIAGCIGAALAAVAGVIDLFGSIPDRSSARTRGYIHGSVNTLALLLFIYASWRQGSPAALPDKITVAIELLGIIAIGYSGWLGGTLVYRNQIGVEHSFANAGKLKQRSIEDFSRPVCNQGELGEGQAMLVHIGDQRIAVARCAEGIFAFEDHCTHRGGPLSDGAIVGCAVQCPWHGSQFDIRSGRIIAGPAEEHLRTYKVEVRAGEVYVKPNPVTPNREKAA
jgi:nitrite reductase/ring-hydroxylating ferredoxin subunit/uncharacterized membrane protein